MKKISLAILTLIVVLASCKKTPEVNLKYVDVERDLITVGTTTATVQCDYQYIATLKKACFHYGEGENEADMNTTEMRVVQNTLYVELDGLRANTTYSYYYEFYNGFNSMRTALKTFKTEAGNGGGDEPPIPPEIMLPTVITAMVTEITTNSAQCGGEVVNDGGAEVTERGICWSTNENPTLSDSHLAAGMGTGVYTAAMGGLEANTTYHVRAYATNSMGTAYGMDKEFVTLSGGGGGGSGDVPTGAINGLFTINENGDQVYFSQGNLQYQASTNTWRFAEHQWDYVGTQTPDWSSGMMGGNVEGSDNNGISSSYDGWIDLFGWGTSGYNHGAVCYQPWSISNRTEDYCPYGSNITNLFDGSGQADWGFNSILNGGNRENLWRTMKVQEWDYVINSRITESGIRYVKAEVNEEKGLLLLPDAWNVSLYNFNFENQSDASFTSNVISDYVWENTLQSNGVVFLPMAGDRILNIEGNGECNVTAYVGQYGLYWSASLSTAGSYRAFQFLFSEDYVNTYFDNRPPEIYFGLAVRLVQDIQ